LLPWSAPLPHRWAGYQAAFTGLVILGRITLLMAMMLNSKATEQIDGAKS
jgi:hypothetical protein